MSKQLTSAHIEVTRKCNLKCKYCYNAVSRDSHQREFSLVELQSVIDQLVQLGCRTLVLSGGEPFARADFMDLLVWLDGSHRGITYRVLTNGTLLSPAIVHTLASLSGLREVRVSYDGSAQSIVRGPRTEGPALRGIRLLVSSGIPVAINTVLTESNYGNSPFMIDVMKQLGVSCWRLDTPFYSGAFVHNQSSLRIADQPALYAAYEKIVFASLHCHPSLRVAISRIWDSSVLDGGMFNRHQDRGHPCDYHQHALTLRADGAVSFCPSWSHVFGNIFLEDIPVIWKRIHASAFGRLRLSDLSQCDVCEYVGFCGGGCRSDALYSGGTLYDPDRRTCAEMKWLFLSLLPRLPAELREKYEEATQR
jgi:radical SAM protein with 4Fe4S-binding SPASM domain